MFGLRVILRPTAPLTFRRIPFSTLEMLTYPFLPPTTLSGFLDRTLRLARGQALPDFSNAGKTTFYALPQSYHVLGALADPGPTIVPTTRHGVRDLGHVAFSRLHQPQQKTSKENYQLYRWEYLFTDALVGYVLHEDEESLEPLFEILNFGCKLGKEGWAYVEHIDGPFALEVQREKARPSCLVPAIEAFGGSTHMYPLYRYAWREAGATAHVLGGGPAPIDGFVPFLAAVVDSPLELDYYRGNGATIPVSLLAYF